MARQQLLRNLPLLPADPHSLVNNRRLVEQSGLCIGHYHFDLFELPLALLDFFLDERQPLLDLLRLHVLQLHVLINHEIVEFGQGLVGEGLDRKRWLKLDGLKGLGVGRALQ